MTIPRLTSRKRWLHLGFDAKTNQRLELAVNLLCTHLQILGPPGMGKTRLLLKIFQELARIPNATLIVGNPKGALCHMAREWLISQGLIGRLDWFNPGEPLSPGYSPLRPNHLPVATHAKAVREGIRASWGQADFDQTAQLARVLFLVLFAVRELSLTLVEAMNLLRPDSQVRKTILPAVSDPYIRESLQYLNSLRDSRQDELTASSLARLESFVLDPAIRQILTQQTRSLDLGEVIANHRILLINLEEYNPLRPDDVRLLGRLLINDIIAHVFNRPAGQRANPVFLLLDEVPTWATADLCRALDKGRELGLHCVLAHQYLEQLKQEEKSGLLYYSAMECARSKVIFGGVSTEELELLTAEVMIDKYDPRRVKDELTALECEPIEAKRKSMTYGESTEKGRGISQGRSYGRTQGHEATQGKLLGVSLQKGRSKSVGITKSKTEGASHTHGYGSTFGGSSSSGHGSGGSSVFTTGETVIPGGLLGSEVAALTTSHASGTSYSDFTSHTDSYSDSFIDTSSNTEAHGEAINRTASVQESVGHNMALSQTRGVSQSQSEGEQQSESRTESRGRNRSVTIAPFYEYRKRRIVSSRQFFTKEEQLTLFLQEIKAQPKGHFLLKVPNHEAVFVRAPFVKDPWVSARRRTAALERVYQQPYYSTPEQIAAEEQERAKNLQRLLPTKAKPPKMEGTAQQAPPRAKGKGKPKKRGESPLQDLVKKPIGRE